MAIFRCTKPGVDGLKNWVLGLFPVFEAGLAAQQQIQVFVRTPAGGVLVRAPPILDRRCQNEQEVRNCALSCILANNIDVYQVQTLFLTGWALVMHRRYSLESRRRARPPRASARGGLFFKMRLGKQIPMIWLAAEH